MYRPLPLGMSLVVALLTTVAFLHSAMHAAPILGRSRQTGVARFGANSEVYLPLVARQLVTPPPTATTTLVPTATLPLPTPTITASATLLLPTPTIIVSATSSPVPTPTITASATPFPPASNLLSNPNFDLGLGGWEADSQWTRAGTKRDSLEALGLYYAGKVGPARHNGTGIPYVPAYLSQVVAVGPDHREAGLAYWLIAVRPVWVAVTVYARTGADEPWQQIARPYFREMPFHDFTFFQHRLALPPGTTHLKLELSGELPGEESDSLGFKFTGMHLSTR
jgi:hypothetical protein